MRAGKIDVEVDDARGARDAEERIVEVEGVTLWLGQVDGEKEGRLGSATMVHSLSVLPAPSEISCPSSSFQPFITSSFSFLKYSIIVSRSFSTREISCRIWADVALDPVALSSSWLPTRLLPPDLGLKAEGGAELPRSRVEVDIIEWLETKEDRRLGLESDIESRDEEEGSGIARIEVCVVRPVEDVVERREAESAMEDERVMKDGSGGLPDRGVRLL